jgi:hypothetical protein
MRLDGDAWTGLITMPVWWVYVGAVVVGVAPLLALWATWLVVSRGRRYAQGGEVAPTNVDDADWTVVSPGTHDVAEADQLQERMQERYPRQLGGRDLFAEAAANARPVEDDPEAPLSHDEWVRWWAANPPSARWRAIPDATPSTRARWIRDWAVATRPPTVVVQQMQRDVGLADGTVKLDTVHDQVDRMREARGGHAG